MENLKKLSDELKTIYSEIENKRKTWYTYLKPLIINNFKSVQKKLDLNLKIREINEIKNLEAVRLTFGFLNSGLFIEKKKKKQEIPPMVLIKKGGYISYSQIANGNVSVFIHYPFIEDIYGDTDKILEIGTFSPEELGKDQILEHIEQFLEEIIKWEKEEKKLIGFHSRTKT